eukprot:NODE_352_length_8960_cov_1.102697.p2 type:complete len:531 gc:universal NODE_352_length_8960_cov_1.102697:4304-5896(+)
MLILALIFADPNDCLALQQFAINLNMPSVNPTVMNEINTQCCVGVVTGVTCNSNIISSINWSNFGLNGTITMNLPFLLKDLRLSNNAITGTLPSTGYPSSLTNLWLDSNSLSGQIPNFPNSLGFLSLNANLFNKLPQQWPTSLTSLYLHNNKLKEAFPSNLPSILEQFGAEGNQLNGSITFPSNIIYMYVGNNQLTGLIPVIPNNMINFDLFYNLFTGFTAPFPNTLKRISAESNQLTGDMPSIPDSLTDLTLSHNQLTGSITMKQPKTLLIDFNSIRDVIIWDISKILSCDVSNNPLMSSQYIQNITSVCVHDNLYAYVEPVSPISSATTSATSNAAKSSLAVFSTTITAKSSLGVSSTTYTTITVTTFAQSLFATTSPQNSNLLKNVPFVTSMESVDTNHTAIQVSTISNENYPKSSTISVEISENIPIISKVTIPTRVFRFLTTSITQESSNIQSTSIFILSILNASTVALYQSKITPFQVHLNTFSYVRLFLNTILASVMFTKTPWKSLFANSKKSPPILSMTTSK